MKKVNVAVLDYDMGNLFSIRHACLHVGLEPVVTSNREEILTADAAILPGVGAFGDAVENLKKYDLKTTIHDFIATGKPLMGVCLGMQLLFSESEEFGYHRGLDVISGKVLKFPAKSDEAEKITVPQIQWNTVLTPENGRKCWAGTPLDGIDQNEYMYFVHSYYVVPSDPGDVLSVTRYAGLEYCSGVKKDNVVAFQFHPEKSAAPGLRIYSKWADNIFLNKQGKRT